MADKDPGQRAVDFFARELRHTKGSFAGKPFILLPWQEKIIRGIFGPVKNGLRIIREAYVEVGKKNGKTELGAGIALYMLFCDGEPGAEIYSAAATREQASLVFNVAEAMIRWNPKLLALVDITKSAKLIVLKDDPTSFYKAISADAGTQDGINPHGVIFDEVHRQKKRDLWAVLKFGSDIRTQPLMFAITTAGIQDESELCWEQHERARQQLQGLTHDASFYPCIYAADLEDDWKSEASWLKANPSMEGNPGGFMALETVRKTCEQAQQSPLQENEFRRFRLSQWVAQETRWLAMDKWDACGVPFNPSALVGRRCYAGLDLSTTLDITALVLSFDITAGELGDVSVDPDTGLQAMLAWFWLPKSGINKRKPESIGLWAKQGLIETTEGDQIDYDAVVQKLKDLRDVYDIHEIGHDRWGATQLVTTLEADGFTCVPIGQGYAGMSAPAKELEARMVGGKLRHNGNPVLRWMADCVAVKQDPAGNIKPVKPDRLKSSKRIDGIVAAIMSTDRLSRNMEQVVTADSVMFG